jgi:hypothetical protein
LFQFTQEEDIVQVQFCCQSLFVISSTAKSEPLFKIYQSDLIKNSSILSLDKDKSTSVLDVSFFKIVIFSPGAKTVLLEALLETSTSQVIR